jgi:hypothetical protein
MRGLIACAVVVLLVNAGAAHAQPAPWQPERSSAGWTFTPGVVFGGAWDSNVTVQSKGDPITAEWVGLVSPRGELDYNGAKTRFNIGYSGSLEAYRRLNELNRYEQRGRMELRRRMSPRLSAYARGGLLATPTTDRLELDAGTLPFVDIGSQMITAATGLQLALGPRTQFDASYRFQDVRFDEEDPRTFDLLRGGYSHTPMLLLMHAVSQRLSLGGSWQYQHARVGDGLETFDLQTASAELAFRLTESTVAAGGGGVSYMHASTADQTSTGPAFHASLQHQHGPVTLSARYEKAFTPVYTFGGVTQNQNLSGSARVAFAGSRGHLSGSVSHGRTDPVEEIGLGFRTDSLHYTGSVGYQLTRWLRTEAFYTGSQQTSSARADVDRARIGVQFVTFKPVRIQ